MPTITAQKIVNDAKTILQETTGVRWSDAELLGWVSAGQREITMLVPSASTKVFTVLATPDIALQRIPEEAHSFLDIVSTFAGAVVTHIDRRLLDTTRRSWPVEAPSAAPLHYVYDPRTPRLFYLYPRPAAGVGLTMICSVCPPELTSLTQTIAIDDIYVNPLLDYVLYRAYSKDLETVGNAERAAGHYAAFSNTLGLKAQAQASNQPVPAAR